MATQWSKVLRNSALLLATVLSVGCRSTDVRGSGPAFEVAHEIDDVREVVVNDTGELRIRNGAQHHLVVLAQEEIHQYLTIRQIGNRLIIEPERGYQLRPSRDLRYLLTADDVSRIDVAGAVDVVAHEYQTESLAIDTSGSTDLAMQVRVGSLTVATSGSFSGNLAGETTHLTLDLNGSADMDAYELTARRVDVDVSGAVTAYITAVESLDVSASGSSNIIYKGNPRVNHSSAGASRVNPAD